MQTKYFQGSGVDLAASVGGISTHPSVVFLHGGGQTRHSWNNAAQALEARGYYVVCLDLRGHGDSSWAPEADYSLNSLVADLWAVLEQIPPNPVLIGASLGGLIALTAIGEATETLAKGLILVDVTPHVDPRGIQHIETFMTAYPDGFANLEEAADAVAHYLPHRRRPTDTTGLQRNLRRGDDGRYYWHWDPDLFKGLDASPVHQSERYDEAARHIYCPTLLVRGKNSQVVKQANVKHFLELIPQADYADISNAGHMVVGDKNDVFNQAVLDFFRDKIHTDVPVTQRNL